MPISENKTEINFAKQIPDCFISNFIELTAGYCFPNEGGETE